MSDTYKEAAMPQEEDSRPMRLQEAFARLDALVGLQKVKQEVRNLIDYVTGSLAIQKARAKGGESPPRFHLHLVFTGNPGTGKTTVARLLGQMLQAIGLLSHGHVVEVDRLDLVEEYVGRTAPKTNKVIDYALGGILEINHPYTLAGDPFGQEAIETLLKRMEDDPGKFVVILSGDKREMDRLFERALYFRVRFANHIHFEDYTPEELKQIFLLMTSERGMKLGEGVEGRVLTIMEGLSLRKDRSFANGRTVLYLLERVLENHAMRLGRHINRGGEVEEETIDRIELEDLENILD
jgi:SpoVK/Ycf46/Vps4 family AAA+-type ATPase